MCLLVSPFEQMPPKLRTVIGACVTNITVADLVPLLVYLDLL